MEYKCCILPRTTNTSKRNAFYVMSVVLGTRAAEPKNLVYIYCCSCPLTAMCLKKHTDTNERYPVPMCTVTLPVKATYTNICTVYILD
jgi:hypothetical protein